MRRAALRAAAAVALFLSVVPVAFAHANYVKSIPEQDARLAKPPTEVRITFSERPEPRQSEIQVLDVNGKRFDKHDLSSLDETTLRVTLQPIGEGGYTVAWHVFSAVDGHDTRGSFAFAIGDAPLPPVPDIPSAPPPSPVEIAGRALSYGGVALLVGIPFFSLYVARSADDRRGLGRLSKLGSYAAIAGALVLLAVAHVALDSRLGLVIAARATLATIALLAPLPTVAALGVGAAAGATLTLQSHAAAIDDLLGQLFDLSHVLAMGAWVGGLAALAVTVLPRREVKGGAATRDLGALVSRFSTLGVSAIAVIVVTGTLQSLRRLVDVRDLVETPYGIALLAKILLLAIAVALASLNLLRHGPRLRAAAPAATRTRRLLLLGVRGEMALVCLVLVAASILTALAPPNYATGAAYSSVQHADGLRIEFLAQSGIPGRNRWIVRLQDGLQPPRDVDRVTLRFTIVEHDMGEQELVMRQRASGEYVGDGSPTSMFGTWHTLVIVRRAGREDASALFTYPIASTGGVTTRVVQAGGSTLIVYTEAPSLSAGQPLTLYVVPLDSSGNLLTDAKLRASLDGQTYQAASEPGRYRIDLPALTAGNKKLVLTLVVGSREETGEYDFSVVP